MSNTLSSDGPTAAQETICDKSTIQPSDSSNSSTSVCRRMGGKDVFLWTVQEGRILNNRAGRGATAPVPNAAVAVDLTRPASFSGCEGVRHTHGDRPVLARGRTVSYDQGWHLLSAMGGGEGSGGGERAETTDRRLPMRENSSDFAQPRRTDVGNYGDDDDDDSCFPPLVRRRTFTEASTTTRQRLEERCYESRRLSSHGSSGNTHGNGDGDDGDDYSCFLPLIRRRTFTQATTTTRQQPEASHDGSENARRNADGGGGGGSGRVPISVSEDNVLALLSKYPLDDSKNTPEAIAVDTAAAV